MTTFDDPSDDRRWDRVRFVGWLGIGWRERIGAWDRRLW